VLFRLGNVNLLGNEVELRTRRRSEKHVAINFRTMILMNDDIAKKKNYHVPLVIVSCIIG